MEDAGEAKVRQPPSGRFPHMSWPTKDSMNEIFECPQNYGDDNATLNVTEEYFVFNGKHYRWSDITTIKRRDSLAWRLFLGLVPGPLTCIVMNDWKRICIQQDLRRKGNTTPLSFLESFGAKTTQDYKNLVNFFESKKKT